jgi:hypothetical protein
MSDQLLLWLFGGAFAGIVTLALLLLAHIKECRDVRAAIATLTTNVKHISSEIGTHETGIRGSLHKLRSEISPFVLWAQRELENRQ